MSVFTPTACLLAFHCFAILSVHCYSSSFCSFLLCVYLFSIVLQVACVLFPFSCHDGTIGIYFKHPETASLDLHTIRSKTITVCSFQYFTSFKFAEIVVPNAFNVCISFVHTCTNIRKCHFIDHIQARASGHRVVGSLYSFCCTWVCTDNMDVFVPWLTTTSFLGMLWKILGAPQTVSFVSVIPLRFFVAIAKTLLSVVYFTEFKHNVFCSCSSPVPHAQWARTVGRLLSTTWLRWALTYPKIQSLIFYDLLAMVLWPRRISSCVAFFCWSRPRFCLEWHYQCVDLSLFATARQILAPKVSNALSYHTIRMSLSLRGLRC